MDSGHNPWCAIVGRGRHGKVEAVTATAQALGDRALRVGGVRVVPAEDGYDLIDLASGESAPLARRTDPMRAEDPGVCDLSFDDAALEVGRRWCTRSDLDVVFLDLGKLEAQGGGLWSAFLEVLAGPPRVVVACLRPEYLSNLAMQLRDPAAWLDLTESDPRVAPFAESIMELWPPIAVFGVRGHSGSGKTRLVEQLIPALGALGARVATVKHASHSLDLDVEGKDSHRHGVAGASRVLLVGPSAACLFVHRDAAAELADWVPIVGADADIVVVEGYKRTPMPHVQLERGEGMAYSLERTGDHAWAVRAPMTELLEYPSSLVAELADAIVGDLLPRRVG